MEKGKATYPQMKSAMWIALFYGHVEVALILARKGADCTEPEKKSLDQRYTNQQVSLKQAAAQGKEEAERKAKEEAARLAIDKARFGNRIHKSTAD